ncbi:MAG: transposase [Candidatus Azotimanducaceae bacterium]|jgi:transposase
MESAMKIRRLVLVEGRSIRSVSRDAGISRNTLKKYLRDDEPPAYKRTAPVSQHKLKDHETTLRQWFEFDLTRPKRERRTAQKLYEQLMLEGYPGSYSPVCRFIKKLKATHGTNHKAFIPLSFKPGDAMQFDWSQEVVVLGDVEQKIKVAHFRLSHSRKAFVVAYPRETQEMLLDAFARSLKFYEGVPQRVLIDNPKTMVIKIGKVKERDFHPRFLALMNHYLMQPVACTPAAGWEKGQIENQVNVLRNQLFKPQLRFESLAALNLHLHACCETLGKRKHPQFKDKTIDTVFTEEHSKLRALGRAFDGYVERAVRVSSTCLVQYDSNHYSVPSQFAKQRISLRVYADHVVMVAEGRVITTHKRSFKRDHYQFEPWHYVSLLKQKPGALRDGAPFMHWDLPPALVTIKKRYLQRSGGDKDFVELLLLIQTYNMEVVSAACELALEEKTTQLPAIVNLINRLSEPDIAPLKDTQKYPQLAVLPEANCQRYEQLRSRELVV